MLQQILSSWQLFKLLVKISTYNRNVFEEVHHHPELFCLVLIFIYPAVLGLGCHTWDLLSSLWHSGSLAAACRT